MIIFKQFHNICYFGIQMNIDELNQINEELLQINNCFRSVFSDSNHKNNLLTKKHTANLFRRIYGLLEIGSVEERIKTKELFLGIYRSYVNNMVKGFIFPALKVCYEEQQLIRTLIEKWGNFKRFIFYYCFLFDSASNYYDKAFKSLRNMGKQNKISEESSIFPLPAIAIQIYRSVIYDQFKKSIHRHLRINLADERAGKCVSKENLRILLQIIWSCGLLESACIKVNKTSSAQIQYEFYKTNQQEIIKEYQGQTHNPQQFIRESIIQDLLADAQKYYLQLFESKLSLLNPIEDFATVEKLLIEEEQRADYYFFTKQQKHLYLSTIRDVLILHKYEQRLTRQKSFKQLNQLYIADPGHGSQILKEIKMFGRVLLRSKEQILPFIEKMLKEYIDEFRVRMNEKISKRKEYIIEIVSVKKAINQIIDEAWQRDISLCVVRDAGFRKLLDTIEASRNLAEMADLKIKECIKSKSTDDEIMDSLKDIFLVLENLVATDSFLIYHQELLGKRLLQSLNQPKIDIQQMFLKSIGEKLGYVSISTHLSMIKDIENSQNLTQNFNKLLPFSSFRWGCRIISPPFWPDNVNKNRLAIELPQTMRIHAQTIANLYHQTYDYRYLGWKLDRGFSLFEGNFPSGKYRFQSENIFMSILFHISEGKNRKILYGNLKHKVTPIKEGDEEYLMKCISVLIDNNLIVRDSLDIHQPYTQGEQIKINLKYQPKSTTKPNQIIMIRVSPEIHKAMHKTTVQQSKIIKERQKLIEAVLVKLLKHSHSMGSNSITFSQLYKGIQEHQYLKNFKFSESVVKQRLEELIAREYCARDEKDRKVYHYIA